MQWQSLLLLMQADHKLTTYFNQAPLAQQQLLNTLQDAAMLQIVTDNPRLLPFMSATTAQQLLIEKQLGNLDVGALLDFLAPNELSQRFNIGLYVLTDFGRNQLNKYHFALLAHDYGLDRFESPDNIQHFGQVGTDISAFLALSQALLQTAAADQDWLKSVEILNSEISFCEAHHQAYPRLLALLAACLLLNQFDAEHKQKALLHQYLTALKALAINQAYIAQCLDAAKANLTGFELTDRQDLVLLQQIFPGQTAFLPTPERTQNQPKNKHLVRNKWFWFSVGAGVLAITLGATTISNARTAKNYQDQVGALKNANRALPNSAQNDDGNQRVPNILDTDTEYVIKDVNNQSLISYRLIKARQKGHTIHISLSYHNYSTQLDYKPETKLFKVQNDQGQTLPATQDRQLKVAGPGATQLDQLQVTSLTKPKFVLVQLKDHQLGGNVTFKVPLSD